MLLSGASWMVGNQSEKVERIMAPKKLQGGWLMIQDIGGGPLSAQSSGLKNLNPRGKGRAAVDALENSQSDTNQQVVYHRCLYLYTFRV